MEEVFQTRTVYLATEGAARKAESNINDWLVAHAGTSEARARRALSDANQAGTYEEGRLSMLSARCTRSPYRRCTTHQVIEKDQAQTGYAYCASLHLWTLEGTLVTGIVGQIYAEGTTEGADAPQEPTPHDTAAMRRVTSFRRLFDDLTAEQNRQQHNTTLDMDIRQRTQVRMPGIYIMLDEPDNEGEAPWQERATELQERHPQAAVIGLDHRMLVEQSHFVPDTDLRRWLGAEYRVVNISEQGHHEVAFPTDAQELADAISRMLEERHTSAQNSIITSLTRNLVALTLLAAGLQSPEPDYDGVIEGLEEIMTPHGLPLASAIFKAPTASRNEPERQAVDLQQKLEETRDQLQTRDNELADAHIQIQNLNEALRHNAPAQAGTGTEQGREEAQPTAAAHEGQAQRANRVLEALTNPDQYSNLRFLDSVDSITEYGKQRPTADEILEVLGDLDRLAGSYYAGQGDIGEWQNHLQRPGWKYAHSEKPIAMGRDQRNRTFNDSERSERIVVQRHLTCLTAGSGLQIFFDQDDEARKFFVAYIGSTVPPPPGTERHL